jgi:hypothetical protein
LLEVVEQEERVLGPQKGNERVFQLPGASLANTKRGRDSRQHERGIHDWREIDEPDTVGKDLQQLGACRQCKPGLAGSSGADERHQPAVVFDQ